MKLASRRWSASGVLATNYGDHCRILLRDGIHELRVRKGRVNYRILYFFHGRDLAILGHAITKEDVVPDIEIERRLRRKRAFESAPAEHTYSEEEEG
jgi:putative component of toxin-antitoxin plasmid stabilization module